MCWDCVREYYEAEGVEWDDDYPFKLPPATPEHVEIMRLMWEFYQLPGCSVGGPLHITLDDTNVEDHNLDFCRQALDPADHWAFEECETEEEKQQIQEMGHRILDALQAMPSLAERALTIQRADVYGDKPGTFF